MSSRAREIVWDDETLGRFWAYHAQFPENYFSYQCGEDVVARVSPSLDRSGEVLDFGCGPGHLLPHLLEAGFRVQAADISLEAMNGAQSIRHPNLLGFRTLDQLANEGRTFKTIFLLEVIEHLSDEWLDKTMRQARGLLATGGKLVVTTPNDENLEDNMVYCPISNVAFHRWQHVRSWTEDGVSQLLTQYGFSPTTRVTSFRNSRGRPRDGRERWLSAMRSLFQKPRSILAIARLD